MAIGDGTDATAAGMSVVLGTALAATLDTLITATRDYLANGPVYWKPGVTCSIAKGGTGATNATDARTALGVYSKAEVDSGFGGKVVNESAGTNAIGLLWGGGRITLRVDGTNQGQVATVADVLGRVDKNGDTITGQLGLPNSFAASSGYTIAYINGDGRVSKGASSERFKDDITPIDPALLGDLFPQLHTFVMKDDPGRMERVGYIAERLDENPDQRRFVVYEREQITENVEDDDGNVIGLRVTGTRRRRDSEGNPVPESIDFIALLLAQVAQLHARVTELEAGR